MLNLDENNWLPAAGVGLFLVVFGGLMIRSHLREWRSHSGDDQIDPFDLEHYRNRFRRRMQTSGAVVVIGILIPLGDILIWQFGPLAATFFWLGIIVIAGWIGLLALGDISAVKSHSITAQARYRQKRQELEAELAELQRRSNGEATE